MEPDTNPSESTPASPSTTSKTVIVCLKGSQMVDGELRAAEIRITVLSKVHVELEQLAACGPFGVQLSTPSEDYWINVSSVTATGS